MVKAELITQVLKGPTVSTPEDTHQSYVLFGDLGAGVTFTLPSFTPAFDVHVRHVVPLASEEEMVGVATRGVVAFVQDTLVPGITVGQEPCVAVGEAVPLIVDPSVTSSIPTPGPLPTWGAKGGMGVNPLLDLLVETCPPLSGAGGVGHHNSCIQSGGYHNLGG